MPTTRFSEPLPMTPVGITPIRSLAKLRTKLGVIDLPTAEQRTRVAGWLKENRPTAALAASIERYGWGDLLPASAA